MDEEVITRASFFGDEVEKIATISPVTGEVMMTTDSVTVYPASHYVTPPRR